MKSRTKVISLLLLPVLMASVLLLKGCGGDDESTSNCPDGSALSTYMDTILISGNITWDPAVFYIPPPGVVASLGVVGGVQVTVIDQFNVPKNNICLVVNTDGILWDKGYTTQLQDANGRYITKTDGHGNATLYMTSGIIVSNPAVSSGTAGEDFDFQYDISVVSGANSVNWEMTGTAQGCPGNTFGPPATCP